MGNGELFASEWQALQHKKQQLINEAQQLEQELRSLTADPAIVQLFTEKDQLYKQLSRIGNEIRMYRRNIERNKRVLEYRRQAATNKKLQKELDARLARRKRRLARLEKSKAPESIIEQERILIFEAEASFEELEAFCQRLNAEEAQKQEVAQRTLDTIKARIAAIEEHYRTTKRCLKEALRTVEQQRQRYRLEEIEWGTQSRDHVAWMLKHQPTYKDDVVRRYKARFPTNNLADLLTTTPTSIPTVRSAGNKKRHARHPSSRPETPPVAPQQPWRFWITFNPTDSGQELPREKGEFLRVLKSVLDAAGYRSNLNLRLVYDKLMSVSKMSLQQRQEMHKLVDCEPEGWKKVRVSRRHRLFLLIDEEKRHIRFLPRQRKKSYSQH